MLGNSWFWFYGALVLAQLPLFVKTVLGGSEQVVTLLLVRVLRRRRHRLAAVREAVRAQGGDRPGAVRLDRPDGVRGRPVVRHARAVRRRKRSSAVAVPARSRARGAC